MISELHKEAVEMWVFSKLYNPEANPSEIILLHLTGQLPDFGNEPQNTIQVCQKINEIKGIGALTEGEKIEIQAYGIYIMESNKGSKTIMLAKALWLTWLNKIGYILAAISIGIGGFSWWIVGFGIGTWWVYGSAKMAAQKHSNEQVSTVGMPVYMIAHFLALLGLIGFSIFNIIN